MRGVVGYIFKEIRIYQKCWRKKIKRGEKEEEGNRREAEGKQKRDRR